MTSALAHIIAYGLFGFNWAFIVAGLIRSLLVPGTRRRYLLATFQWATVAPALLFSGLSIIAGERFWGAFSFVLTLYHLYLLYRDGDDNWWRRKRKQLRQRLTVQHPALAGSKA